jgi:hypothetical protein
MSPAIFALALLLAGPVEDEWRPPAKPNPQEILNEARTDALAGRYADALAKHVWFHENALKYAPSLYGVRLSFALGYWGQLCSAYPPALQKLKTIRDETGKTIRTGDPAQEAFQRFHDYAAINRALGEDSKTTELFDWLDGNKPKVAAKAFRVAEPALIRSKQYRLCGKYIDPDRSFAEILNAYRVDKEMAKTGKHREVLLGLREKAFSNSTATLVALLVVNDRKADALKVAEKALKEHDDPLFRAELEKAEKGEVPPPWP